jgi:hypothetical protein
MRKLLHLIDGVLKNQLPFDPNWLLPCDNQGSIYDLYGIYLFGVKHIEGSVITS